MKNTQMMHKVAFLLLLIGGLNWLLIGAFNFNLVSTLLGTIPMLEKIVYLLVGISAVYIAATHKKDCKMCN